MPKLALVTGASAGIGQHLARLIAADGYDLILVARRRERLQTLADELSAAHNVNVEVMACDLADATAREQLGDAITDRPIDVLVNNAGLGDIGAFHSSERGRQLTMVRLNMEALTDLTHRVLPGMVARGRGQVLNIASTAAFQPGPGMSVYYATKAYVLSLSEALSHELRGTGVTVTAHCPGATESEFGDVAGNGDSMLFKTAGVASGEAVAAHAWAATKAGRVVPIHGLMNAMAAFSVRFSPRFLVLRLTAWLNSK